MADFSNEIKSLTEKLNSFIKEYENLDDKDPLSMNLLKSFKKKIQHFNTSSIEYISSLKTYNSNFESVAKNEFKENAKKINEATDKLNIALDIIKSKYQNKNENIKSDIKTAKDNLRTKINELDLEVDFFVAASQQKVQIYEDEYEQNVKKYNYQIEVAQDSYDYNIKEFNDEYFDRFDIHEKKYLKNVKKIDFETNKTNEYLQSRITEYENLLKKYLNNLRAVNFDTKEKNRKESIALNKEIKTLVEERNADIVVARNHYMESLNSSTASKEEKHQEYQSEGQKIQKEFVISISEQDEFSNACKKDYDNSIKKEKKEYYFNSLDETLKQNKILEELNDEIDDPKVLKRKIKIRNKYTYLKRQESRLKCENSLNEIERYYQLQAEDIRYNKAVLEMNKNHSIKIINTKEQTDNKYYQELNSIYENDMNLAIKAANIKYNQKANSAKCESRIRLKHIEKDSDVAEANLQKNIEGLNTEIAKLQAEISLNSNLRDTIYAYETDLFNCWKKTLNVSNTVEIEKCKILNNYNKRQYANNILISKAVLNYGKQKLDLENKEFVDIHDTTIEIEKAKLNDELNNYNYKIKLNQEYQSEDEQIQIRNSIYEMDVLKNDLSEARYKDEIKIINQAYSTFINLSREVETFTNSFIFEFFDSIQIRPEYERMIANFLFNFNSFISKYYEELLNKLTSIIQGIVDNRLKFDEQNKFSPYYKDLETQKEAELKILYNKKNAIEETLKTYNDSLLSYSNRIYNIKNQRELVKQKMASKDSKNRESLKIEFRNYNQKIKEFTERFEEVSGLRESTNKEFEKLNNRIEKTINDYEKRYQEIKDMQQNASSAYNALISSIKKYIQTINSQELSFRKIYKFDFSLFTYSHIKKEIDNRNNSIINDNNTIFEKFYEIIHQFRETIINTMQKNKELLLNKFQNDIYHISARTNDTLQELNEEINDKNNECKDIIASLEAKKRNIIKDYDQKLADLTHDHYDEIANIKQHKQESLECFYNEFHAMCRNQDFINHQHNSTIKFLNSNNYTNKQKLNSSTVDAKKNMTLKLEQFIESKESLINHLPIATKYFEANMARETEENNTNLDLELKNARFEAYQNKKSIEKQIATIQLTGNLEIDTEKANYEKNLILEKRKHNRINKKIDKTRIEYNI